MRLFGGVSSLNAKELAPRYATAMTTGLCKLYSYRVDTLIARKLFLLHKRLG